MIVNYHDLKEGGSHQWAILELVGMIPDKFWTAVDPSKMEIKLTIDGYEIDFFKLVEAFERCVEGTAKDIAETMIYSRTGNIRDALDELEAEAIRQVNAMRIHEYGSLNEWVQKQRGGIK